jgi:hypothetical protein
MHRSTSVNSQTAEALEPKLSMSSVSDVSGPTRVSTIQSFKLDDDPLPDPEPAPIPYPLDGPPIDYPLLPPSGPAGPGS